MGQRGVAGDPLGADSLLRGHPHASALSKLRARLVPEALVWLRTCETFGADSGQRFARGFSDFMGTRVAGHTYVIGPWQSGLHCLAPGAVADWPADEGLDAGTPRAPSAKISTPLEPRTVTCLEGKLPAWA